MKQKDTVTLGELTALESFLGAWRRMRTPVIPIEMMTPEALLQDRQVRQALCQSLLTLEPIERKVLVLCFCSDCTPVEISKKVGVLPSDIHSIQNMALSKMRDPERMQRIVQAGGFSPLFA